MSSRTDLKVLGEEWVSQENEVSKSDRITDKTLLDNKSRDGVSKGILSAEIWHFPSPPLIQHEDPERDLRGEDRTGEDGSLKITDCVNMSKLSRFEDLSLLFCELNPPNSPKYQWCPVTVTELLSTATRIFVLNERRFVDYASEIWWGNLSVKCLFRSKRKTVYLSELIWKSILFPCDGNSMSIPHRDDLRADRDERPLGSLFEKLRINIVKWTEQELDQSGLDSRIEQRSCYSQFMITEQNWDSWWISRESSFSFKLSMVDIANWEESECALIVVGIPKPNIHEVKD